MNLPLWKTVLASQYGAALDMLENAVRACRHVQHHTAQLNLLLRQRTDSAPRWVGRSANL
jgi:hypothetical protein